LQVHYSACAKQVTELFDQQAIKFKTAFGRNVMIPGGGGYLDIVRLHLDLELGFVARGITDKIELEEQKWSILVRAS